MIEQISDFVPFKPEHRELIVPNEFTDIEALENILSCGAYDSYSLIENGEVKVILCFYKYHADNYSIFIMASQNMNSRDAIKMKRLLEDAKRLLPIERLETTSEDCDKLNRWHYFLGFHVEGVKRRFLHGKDYKMWAIVREV